MRFTTSTEVSVAPQPATTTPMLTEAASWSPWQSREYAPDDLVLFVVRESSTGADEQLLTQAAGVLFKHRYREGLSELLQAGLRPFYEPQRYGGRTVPLKRERASIVRVGNSIVLYALSSASQDNDGTANAFTDLLVTQMMRHRPKAVVVGPFSRMSRSGLYFSTLLRAFNDTRAVLESNEETIDFKRPDAESRFFRLCERSAEDRRTLVMRLEAGHRNAWHANQRFSFGGERLPLGYRKSDDRVVVLDSNIRVQVVREVLEMLADPTVTVSQAGRHIVASGAFTALRRRRRGDDKRRNVGLDCARTWVRRLLERIDNYERGFWVLARKVIIPIDPRDPVEEFEWQLPLPLGGWATPETFAGLRERVRMASEENNRRGTASVDKHQVSLPLTGFDWVVGTEQWAIRVSFHKYRLLRRTIPLAAQRQGPASTEWARAMRREWNTKVSGPHHVLTIRPEDFHRSVGDTFGQLDSFVFQEADRALDMAPDRAFDLDERVEADLIEVIRRDLEAARAKSAVASRLLYRPENSAHMIEVYERDYAAAEEAVRRLELDLRSVEVRSWAVRSEEGWRADASPVLAVLARLAVTTGPVPRAAVAALQAVLRNLSVRVDDGQTVTWTASLAIPAREGRDIRVVGPVSNTVAAYRSGRKSRDRTKDVVSILTRPTGEVVPSDDELSFIEKTLDLKGVTKSAMQSLLCSPRPARQVIAAYVANEDAQIAKGYDPGYVDLVRAGYVRNGHGQRTWNLPGRERQAFLDLLHRQGPMRIDDVIAASPQPIARRRLEDLLRRPDGTWLAIADVRRSWEGESKNGGQRVTAKCRVCPHCQADVDIVARVRECPAGLLCSACLKMPVLGSPTFPDEYRRLAKRPQIRRLPDLTSPSWWSTMSSLIDTRPGQTVTTLVRALGQNRHDIQMAADAMGIKLHGWQTLSTEWTDERIRQAYLHDDRSLAELADEMGVSIGTLSNRLRGSGLLKQPRAAQYSGAERQPGAAQQFAN